MMLMGGARFAFWNCIHTKPKDITSFLFNTALNTPSWATRRARVVDVGREHEMLIKFFTKLTLKPVGTEGSVRAAETNDADAENRRG